MTKLPDLTVYTIYRTCINNNGTKFIFNKQPKCFQEPLIKVADPGCSSWFSDPGTESRVKTASDSGSRIRNKEFMHI